MQSPLKTHSTVTPSRGLSPEKSAHAFVTQMSDQREVFDIIRAEVDKLGYLGKPPPLLHRQATYYDTYIRPSHRFLAPRTTRNTETVGSGSPKLRGGRGRFQLNVASNMSLADDYNDQTFTSKHGRNKTIDTYSRRKPFVPLRDLLKKGHADRVQDYLDKMNGLTIDEIENGSIAAGKTEPASEKRMKESMRGSTMGATPR